MCKICVNLGIIIIFRIIIKVLEYIIGENLSDFGFGGDYFSI